MKPITIKTSTDEERAATEAKLAPWLEAAQVRCTARLIGLEDIQLWISRAEDKIFGGRYHDHRIPKKALEGTEIECDPHAQSFPRKYTKHGKPYSTHFRAQFHAGKWQVTEIWRDWTGTSPLTIKLSDTAKNAIISAIQKW